MIDHNSSLNNKTSGSGYPPLSASQVWQGDAGRISPASVSTKKVRLTNISRYMLGLAQATRKLKLVFYMFSFPSCKEVSPRSSDQGLLGRSHQPVARSGYRPRTLGYRHCWAGQSRWRKFKASSESTLTANFENLKTNLTFLYPFSILYTQHINKTKKNEKE